MRYPSVLSGGRIIVFRRCLMSEPPHLVEESVIDNALIFRKKSRFPLVDSSQRLNVIRFIFSILIATD